MIFKTKALDFIEIYCCVFWINLVNRNSCNWPVCSIINFIKTESCLPSIYYHCRGSWLELPRNFILSVAQKIYFEFSENVYLIIFKHVVFVGLSQVESKFLTYDSIEWNSKEVRAEQEQNYSVDSVEFSPLSFFPECTMNRRNLSSLSNLEG